MIKKTARMNYHLVLDVGTTGVKSFLFDARLRVRAHAYLPLAKFRPRRGWVEQDPETLVRTSKAAIRAVAGRAQGPIRNMGITNQRETTILWDRATGAAIYPAIVWEDTRTAATSAALAARHGASVRERTGLPIDPYFSATKISWILRHVPRARRLLSARRLAFGTVDSWLLFRLAAGRPHLTDMTNASRTLLFDIRRRCWNPRLLKIFGVPPRLLPAVRPSRSLFGHLDPAIAGRRIPIAAICGDQEASMYAAGVRLGATKVTYGTGTFIMQSLGKQFLLREGFFTTLIPSGTSSAYALESKINASGARVAKLLENRKKLDAFLDALAVEVSASLARLPRRPRRLVLDGGITRAPFLLRAQARAAGIPVRRARIYDGSALGVALLLARRAPGSQ